MSNRLIAFGTGWIVFICTSVLLTADGPMTTKAFGVALIGLASIGTLALLETICREIERRNTPEETD